MNILKLVAHLGSLLDFEKSFQAAVVSGIANKGMPDKDKIKALLDGLRGLLDSGIVDIPGVDDAMISEAIKTIEDKLLA